MLLKVFAVEVVPFGSSVSISSAKDTLMCAQVLPNDDVLLMTRESAVPSQNLKRHDRGSMRIPNVPVGILFYIQQLQ